MSLFVGSARWLKRIFTLIFGVLFLNPLTSPSLIFCKTQAVHFAVQLNMNIAPDGFQFIIVSIKEFIPSDQLYLFEIPADNLFKLSRRG